MKKYSLLLIHPTINTLHQVVGLYIFGGLKMEIFNTSLLSKMKTFKIIALLFHPTAAK